MSWPQVYVRNGDRDVIGELSDWRELKLVQSRNDVGRWELHTRSAETAALLSPVTDKNGAIVEARGVIIRRDGKTLASGWCDGSPNAKSDGRVIEWSFAGWDDTVLLSDALAWPNPSAPIENQGRKEDVRTGPASNRIRDYFLQNVQQRQGIPGARGGDYLNLGPNRKSRARFRGLLELSQAIAKRDLNFAIRQRDSDKSLFLFQWLPVDKRDRVHFTPDLGHVHGWSHTITPASATHVVIGAGGEEENRAFREYRGHVSEGELGGVRKIERFKDMSGLDPSESGWEDEALDAAREFLDESTSRASFSIELSPGPDLRYGIHYEVGDLVLAYIGQDENSQPVGLIEDLIEEAEITWNEEGERAAVNIGAPDTETTNRRLERWIRLLQRQLHYQGTYK